METNTSENKETITLIWFDPQIGTREDTEITKNRLRQINNYVVFHTKVDLCVADIQSISKEKIFLIICGSLASELLPQLKGLNQVDSIFLFCMKRARYEHLMNEYRKIIGVYADQESLCASIMEQVNLVNKQLETFSFFDQHQRAIKDLSKQSAEFLWFQLFKDLILRLPRNLQAKQEMVTACRHYYRGNSKEQNLIDEFERHYKPEESIRWYSKQSFVYKLVNKALRSEDIDQLQSVRFFVSDISKSLAYEHQKFRQSEEKTLTVFRGAQLDADEFNKIRQNEGKLISTNGFFSTSRRRSLAIEFVEKRSRRIDVMPVLYVIRCNVQELEPSVIFADIAQFSDYPEEEEVLFDLSATFQLDSIEQMDTLWLIHMTPSSAAHAISEDYLELQRQETEEKSVAIVFGRLMCTVGQYDKSLKYFEQLLADPNEEDRAWIEFNIGRAFVWKSDCNAARKWFDSAYDRMINATPPRIQDSAAVLRSTGVVLYKQRHFDEALHFLRQALTIQQKCYPLGHKDIAWNLNCIGSVLCAQGKYESALDHYERSLDMQKKFLPSEHIDIAWILNNIGSIYHQQGKYKHALELHQQALDIQEKFYPVGHVGIAWSLNAIGAIYQDQGKYDEALALHERALSLQEKFYASGHLDIALSLNNIGAVLREQRKYDQAVDFHRRALGIQENMHPSGHVKIADSLHNIGLIYLAQHQYDHALDYLKKAVQMKVKFLPDNHPSIAQILVDVGSMYESMKEPKMALKEYQTALAIYEKTVPIEHFNRQKTEQRICQLRSKKSTVKIIEHYSST